MSTRTLRIRVGPARRRPFRAFRAPTRAASSWRSVLGSIQREFGERVLVEPVFRDPVDRASYRAVYFGSECDGAFAEFAKAPAVHAHKVLSALSDAELASFPCAYSAAENMLARAGLRPGETVLITGASGGVGSAAVQLAKRRGARIVAIAGASKVAAVEALGASLVLPRDADLVAAVGRETADVVVDVVGGRQFPQLLDVLRRGGRYAVAGAIAGPIIELDLRTVYLQDLNMLGCTILGPGCSTTSSAISNAAISGRWWPASIP